MDKSRKFGILIPIFSLPSYEGIGTFGKEAYRFADFAHDIGARVWQVLPLTPTGYGDSPYQSCCSYALNYYFIDLEALCDEGLLKKEEISDADLFTTLRRVDYGKQFNNKIALLRKAFNRFNKEDKAFKDFVNGGRFYYFAAFMALKVKFSYRPWNEWDEPYRSFDEAVVKTFVDENKEEFLFWQFTQFKALNQWNALKSYVNSLGISVMGDVPLYLSYDSVEMWKDGDELFLVDENRNMTLIAGCPPDAFNPDGQKWGNPLYDWDKMKKDGYKWWNERLKYNLKLYDIIRLDHFRGFDRFYAVPASAPDAREGTWKNGPAEELFKDKLDWNIVAEDLCVYDDGVARLMKNTGYPGMKILEEGMDGNPKNGHKPSVFSENTVCCTSTHDSATTVEYYTELSAEGRKTFRRDLSDECGALNIPCAVNNSTSICMSLTRLAMVSKAFMVMLPIWDILHLGGEARINMPGTMSPDNWTFRILRGECESATKKYYLTSLFKQYNR